MTVTEEDCMTVTEDDCMTVTEEDDCMTVRMTAIPVW